MIVVSICFMLTHNAHQILTKQRSESILKLRPKNHHQRAKYFCESSLLVCIWWSGQANNNNNHGWVLFEIESTEYVRSGCWIGWILTTHSHCVYRIYVYSLRGRLVGRVVFSRCHLVGLALGGGEMGMCWVCVLCVHALTLHISSQSAEPRSPFGLLCALCVVHSRRHKQRTSHMRTWLLFQNHLTWVCGICITVYVRVYR